MTLGFCRCSSPLDKPSFVSRPSLLVVLCCSYLWWSFKGTVCRGANPSYHCFSLFLNATCLSRRLHSILGCQLVFSIFQQSQVGPGYKLFTYNIGEITANTCTNVLHRGHLLSCDVELCKFVSSQYTLLMFIFISTRVQVLMQILREKKNGYCSHCTFKYTQEIMHADFFGKNVYSFTKQSR